MSLINAKIPNSPTPNEAQPSTTVILEEKKLRLEIEELQKPWYKKPTFFVPIFGALSSLFILWITGFFNTKIESLSTKREALTIVIERLNNQTSLLEVKKIQLAQDSANLEKAKKSLVSDTTILWQRADSLSKKVGFLNGQIFALNTKISILLDSLKLATKPNLRIGDWNNVADNNTGIFISNDGIGTAFFEQIKFEYHDKVYVWRQRNDIYEILDAMGINGDWIEWRMKEPSGKLENAGSLGPGQDYYILRVNKGLYSDYYAKIFMYAIQELKIEIIYYSTSGRRDQIKWHGSKVY